jgi:hypothetical protein
MFGAFYFHLLNFDIMLGSEISVCAWDPSS